MRILDKTEEIDADVTWEDQQNICEYSRLNHHRVDLKDEVASLTKELETLKSAEDEIELLILEDDQQLMLQFGTSFVNTDEEGATEHIQHLQRKLQSKLDAKQAAYDSVVDQMKLIRESLYSKFRTTINLEIE
ncbi:hypothetical protein GEMRC1_007027 [Eukaryota sp. GEM-RC1]